MPETAGSRSLVQRTISVRPPLSSVMSRSAATFTRPSLLPPLFQRELPPPPPPPPIGGCGTGVGTVGGGDGGGRRPGMGNGSGTGRGGPPRCQLVTYWFEPAESIPI